MSIDERIKELNSKSFEKKSYSVEEVMQILGVVRQTVYKLIKQGCFKAVRVEKGYRIKKYSFDKWLDGNGGGTF